MPNTKSAKKRHKQNTARRTRNRATIASLKTQIRKVREAVAVGDVAKADTEFRVAAQKLDRAAARNTVHANKSARVKSRLQRLIKAKKTAGPSPAPVKAKAKG